MVIRRRTADGLEPPQRGAESVGTATASYAARLMETESVWWKRMLDVQAPYRWHLRSLRPGYTLDVGCGIGRNLAHLRGHGIGIDHNETSVAIARARGLWAFTPEEFDALDAERRPLFDSILLSHVVEHMTSADAVALLGRYLRRLRPAGRVILIAPQERGFASDASHVQFMDFAELHSILARCGLQTTQAYSFPFPRSLGGLFKYNEFVCIGIAPGTESPGPR